jgi:hypothetical protein
MRRPATLSLLLHLLVLAICIFGLPLLEPDRDLTETAVAVSLVNLADITNPPPPAPKVQTAQAEPQPAPKPEPPPPPKPEPPPPPPPPPPPAPKPEPPPPPPPPPPEPKPEPKPEPPPPPPKPEPPKPEPPKPEPPKPEPPKPPPPKPQPNLMAMLEKGAKDVQKQKPKPKPPDLMAMLEKGAQEAKKTPVKPSPQANQVASAVPNNPEQAIGGKEQDLIRGGVQPCWSFDSGVMNARDLVVRLRVTIDGEGRYASAEVLDRGRYASDPAFRSAADAARRAVMNPRCNKVPLPPDRVARLMPGFTFNFDPKDFAL